MSASPAPYLSATCAEHSVESLYLQHASKSAWIYWLGLLGVGGSLALLPLVPVEITVRSRGMVRPATERIELKAATGGRVARVLAHDNERVAGGQPLVELLAPDVDERLARNCRLQQEKSDLVADLAELTGKHDAPIAAETRPPELLQATALPRSPALASDYARFRAQYAASCLTVTRTRQARDRTVTLAAKGIVTDQECDESRYAAARAWADLQLFFQQSLAGWQAQRRDEQTALDQLRSEEKRLREERALACMRAPAPGTVQGLIGLTAGTYVTPGQLLGYVSPDATLLVETYVSSKDIGQVRTGQVVRLQIDAFPYAQWGLLEGRIVDVAVDATTAGQSPAYKVLVRPMTPALHLRNGAIGSLRKGMTLTARFVTSRQSLWQVLYEDASAWLGPQDQPSSA